MTPRSTSTEKPRRNPSSSTLNHSDPGSKPRKPNSYHLLTPPDNHNANTTIRTTTTPFHTLDTGLDELVSKLQALQAHEHHDQVTPVLDPLPPNAKCPGAPKIPAVFTMPLFASDHDCQVDENLVPFQQHKRLNSHRMSPLAEVTEAYTGLQGGWSPPLQTSSPLLETYSFHAVAIPSASAPVGPSQSIQPDHEPSHAKALGISFYVEKLAPANKRRREPTFTSVSSSSQTPSLARKGPLRI